MAELAEGARLLSEYGAKVPSRVRIPLSPPPVIKPGIMSRVFYWLSQNARRAAGEYQTQNIS